MQPDGVIRLSVEATLCRSPICTPIQPWASLWSFAKSDAYLHPKHVFVRSGGRKRIIRSRRQDPVPLNPPPDREQFRPAIRALAGLLDVPTYPMPLGTIGVDT
jgi:hypothetical protein